MDAPLKQAEVAIIDTKAGKLLKKIVEAKHQLSFATRPIDAHSIFVNPKDGAIYLNCMGAWGFKPGFDGGILRIKKGETEFDADYALNIAQAKSGKLQPHAQLIWQLFVWAQMVNSMLWLLLTSWMRRLILILRK